MKKIHLNIIVKGKVQAVFFRQGTKAVADQLGVTGWVRNEKDGTVSIEAEATEMMMKNFLMWCNDGPDRAMVESVETSEAELQNFTNFIVKK
ncbi:MAG: acylphosphatase [bacterium]|jgi:acylphosphatase